MVPFWPDVAKTNSGPTKAMNDFAHVFDAIKKIVVFSRSLENVEQKNASIVRTNLKDEIRLLEGATLQEKLQLVESKVFASGCVALRYTKG